MVTITYDKSQCVHCGLPCLGSDCPNCKVAKYYCDNCGDDVAELYEYDGEQLCEDCLLKIVPKVD